MKQTQAYLNGWKALGALLHSGHSLSGRERNCFFLNTQSPRFADASATIGFDHPSDSRGIAQVDWDGDGDLDLWISNRTSPRVRFLQNDLQAKNRFVSFRLRGVQSNRDAIGARVELVLSDGRRIVRSISAGEGFVSQASKTVHFGLGPEIVPQEVIVRWPGGKQQSHRDFAINQHFHIVEGSSELLPRSTDRPRSRDHQESISRAFVKPAIQRIAPSHRLPLPTVNYRDWNGQQQSLGSRPDSKLKKPILINLWATWCQPCLDELSEWKSHQRQFSDADLRIIALNVDLAEASADTLSNGALSNDVTSDEIVSEWVKLDLPFEGGIINGPTFELFEIVERTLSLNQSPLPIPTSFLFDENRRLFAVYKGPVKIEQLLRDTEAMGKSHADIRDAAVPFRGRWYSDPFPNDLIAIPSQMVGLSRGADAFAYLQQNIHPKPRPASLNTDEHVWQQLGVTTAKMASVFDSTAKLLLSDGRADDAIKTYRKLLELTPDAWDTHVRLSSLLIGLDRPAEALKQNQAMSKLRKNHPLPWNNIAWILATTQDEKLRDVNRAIEMAERICELTEFREPSTLDTLATAYGEAKRFPDAVRAAKRAVDAAEALRRPSLVAKLRARLKKFQAAAKRN